MTMTISIPQEESLRYISTSMLLAFASKDKRFCSRLWDLPACHISFLFRFILPASCFVFPGRNDL